jgi:hypothetical protein
MMKYDFKNKFPSPFECMKGIWTKKYKEIKSKKGEEDEDLFST